MISATDYFEQHHLRDILDHFVCLYVRGQTRGTAKAPLPAALTAAHDAAHDLTMTDMHPQVQVITALRAFLQNMRAERQAWQSNHRYIVLLPAHGMNEAQTTAIRDFADYLCTALGSVAILLSPAGRHSGQARKPSETAHDETAAAAATAAAASAHTRANVREELAQDEEGEQKRVDRFRATTVAQLSRLLHYTPYTPAPQHEQRDEAEEGGGAEVCGVVVLAQAWPCAIADALLLEDLLGAPQCVVHIVNDKHNDTISHNEEEVEEQGVQGAIAGQAKGGRVKVQEIQREAGFTSALRERRALLSYYNARNVLREVDVSADPASLTREGGLAEELLAMLRPSS